ncbi:MAG TPA: threonine/serine dehydratase [Steroidobacteraceae bacterium]|nr:threonine/serine dehydratase [Steroidobacteraceae bacterium]
MIDKPLLELAWRTVRKAVRWTPLLHSDYLDALIGARVYLKAESLQIGGSFKMRGAFFRVSRLSRAQRRRGVVAFSSGNFAQALALAGRRAEVPVTIVMPADAPRRKIELTQRAGATVVLTEHGERNREEVASERARQIAAEQQFALLHPFDDPWVVAGQSTLMREVLMDARREDVRFDAVLCPVGGGGLIAGTALTEKHFGQGAEIIAVEPDACDDMRRSLLTHRRERNVGTPRTICDAMQAVTPGAIPFEAASHLISRGIVADDMAVRRAMRIAFEEFKIVLEPSGAIALAAALEHRSDFAGRTLALLCCGGSLSVDDLVRLTSTTH